MKAEYCSLTYHQIKQKENYFAEEVTLVLVLEGSVVLEDEGKQIPLSTNQVYCINLNHLVTFFPRSRENLLLFFSIDSLFFAAQFPPFFDVAFSVPGHLAQSGTGNLTGEILELAINDFSRTEEQTIYRMMKLEAIILLLVQKFQEDVRHSTILSKNLRLRNILEYIDENYASGLKVKDIAEHFFLSESALSKAFKKETGDHLLKYLRKIQIHKSLSELLYTKKSIEQLALDFGFNSGKVYREQFKTVFGVTPADYRHEHQQKRQLVAVAEPSPPADLAPKKILRCLYTLSQSTTTDIPTNHFKRRNKQLSLQADSTNNTPKKEAEAIIQISSLSDLAKSKTQKELLLLKKNHGLSCISCLRLFSSSSTSYLLARKIQMNSFPEFEELDDALRFLKEHQLSLMLTISAPRYEKLGKDVYEHFFLHVRHKFGTELLKKIRVNIEFSKNFMASELTLCRELQTQAKQFSSDIQLGIKLPLPDPFSEAAVHKSLQQLYPLILQCDFLSFSAEPNVVFQLTEEASDLGSYHQYVYTKTQVLLKELAQLQLQLPIYLLEWNTLTGTTISYNGLFFRGAIIVSDMLRLDKLIAGYGFWLNIENHERELSQGDSDRTGLDLFHFQSKPRPSYFCLQLARRIQGRVLSEGDYYLFVKNQDKYQLLLWNTNYFDPHLSSEEAFMESQALEITITIKELFARQYQVKQLTLDRDHGALFYVYRQFQQAKILDHETEAYIDAKTQLDLQVFDVKIEQEFSHFLTMDTNAVTLLELTPL